MKYRTCSAEDLKCARYKCSGNGVLRLETTEGEHVDSGSEDTMLTCANTNFAISVSKFCPDGSLDCQDGQLVTNRAYAVSALARAVDVFEDVKRPMPPDDLGHRDPRPAVQVRAQAPPQAYMEEYLTKLGGPDLAASFSRCAFVENAAALSGKGHGQDIDMHDTVIRIGVVPTSEFEADYGNKTDIYFAPIRDSSDRYLREGYDVQYMGRVRERCSWCGDGSLCSDMCLQSPHRLCRYVGDTENCPFSSLVLSGAAGTKGHVEVPGVQQADFPIGLQSEIVASAMHSLEGLLLNGKRSTLALQAFFTFGPLCESSTFYGYDLMGTPETVERKLLRGMFPVTQQVLESTVVAELVYEGQGLSGTNTGIELATGKESCDFRFHPGAKGGLVRSCAFGNQDLGWTPLSGLVYQFRITLHSDGNHLFEIAEVQNLARRWSMVFKKPGFFAVVPVVKAWTNEVGGEVMEIGKEVQLKLEGHHSYKLIIVGQLSAWAVDGCPATGPSPAPELLDADILAAVRCCSMDGRTCQTQSLGCQWGTFPQTEAICAARGLRLCTRSELEKDVCCNTGCNFDGVLAWTSTQLACTSLCDARKPLRVDQLKAPCSDPRVSDVRSCLRLQQLVGKLEKRKYRRVD
mmetsp:Transcript_57484/g.186736  ORF Transcript_57484/g.186736 Transcript_57484/m.186736 type:complete len:631 (-) Transcript_57484:609-2501(-)